METIGILVLYFTCGRESLHPMTQLWLDSCAENPTVDWLFYTDCDMSKFEVPENVTIYETSFEKIKNVVQSKFDFDICLEVPYKLCDFRPAYGEIFADRLSDYDFWGFCDIDLVWGDIRKFITKDILERYDRILTHGHCSLFRNTDVVNKGYRTLDRKGCLDHKSVFTSKKAWAYDEWAGHNGGGYAEIQKRNGIRIYDEMIYADIQIDRYSLHTTRQLSEKFSHEKRDRYSIFSIKNGQVIEYYLSNAKVKKREYIYIHLQQRKLVFSEDLDRTDYLIVPPNRAIDRNGKILTDETLKKLSRGNVFGWNLTGQIKRHLSRVYHIIKR